MGAIEMMIRNLTPAAIRDTASLRLARSRSARIAPAANSEIAMASMGLMDSTTSNPLALHYRYLVDLEGGPVAHQGD